MKLKILLFVAIVALMIASCKSDTPVMTNQVTLSGLSFSPKTLSVTIGTMVTWTNKEAITHSVTSNIAGLFDSGDLTNGKTFSHTFTTAGTFPYHCMYHDGMTGTVIVTAASTGSGN